MPRSLIHVSCASQAFRLRGNDEFKNKNFAEAVRFYTEAISVDDADMRLYSNRAICRVQLGHYDDAIADADVCNGIAPRDFVKHLNTKATALAKLNKRADARAVVQSALDRSPENARSQELLQELGDATEDEDDAGSSSATPSAGGAAAGGIGGTLGRLLLQDGAAVKLLLMSTRAAALMGTVAFMLSGLVLDGATGTWAFYSTLLAAVLLNLYHSLRGAASRNGGVVTLSMDFAGALFEQSSTPLVMLGATFVGSRPNVLVLWPMLCYELMFLSGSLGEYVPIAKPLLKQAGTTIVGALGGPPGFDAMTEDLRIANAHPVLGSTSAQVQLLLMLTMVIELAFPTRNIIGVLLHGQNLMLQYAVSPFMQSQVRGLHGAVHGYAHHPSVPGLVGSTFDSVVSAVSSFTDLRARAAAEAERRSAGDGGGGGGLLSSCAVM